MKMLAEHKQFRHQLGIKFKCERGVSAQQGGTSAYFCANEVFDRGSEGKRHVNDLHISRGYGMLI